MRILSILAALLAAGVALYLVIGGAADPGEPSGLSREGDVAEGDVELRGLEPGLRERVSTAPSPPGSSGAEEEGTIADVPRRAILGRVEGLGPGEHARTRIEVHALGDHDWVRESVDPAAGTVAADGAFEVELGAWLAHLQDLERVRIRADHPDYVVATAKLTLDSGAPEAQALEEPLRLVRAYVVEGVVRTENGAPVEAGIVALYALNGDEIEFDGNYDALMLDRVATTGEFRLRTSRAGPALLAAGLDDHIPTSRRIVLAREADGMLHELILTPGHVIRGHVTLNGRPVANANVRATLADGKNKTDLYAVGGQWVDGRLHSRGGLFGTGEDGSFTLRGFDAAPRRVRVQSVDGHLTWRSSTKSASTVVTPPADGVVLDIEAAVIHVEVRSGDELIEKAQVGVRQMEDGGSSYNLAATGALKILLPPDTPVFVVAEHGRYGEAEQKIEGQPAGSTRSVILDLGPPKARGSVRVTLKDEEGKPVTRAGFQVVEAHHADTTPGFDSGLGLKTSETGEYLLEDLDAGEHILLVTPDRAPHVFHGHFLRLQQRVTIPAAGEMRVDLVARKGARVVLRVQGKDGKLVDSHVTLRDGRGEEISVSWFWSDEDTASVSSGGPGGAESTMAPPLAPGAYTLEVGSEGYQKQTVRFSVQAGETKQLDVRLQGT